MSYNNWQEAKTKILAMDEKEKRSIYKCDLNFISWKSIETWYHDRTKSSLYNAAATDRDNEIAQKVALIRADITRLEIDCIVNAANEELAGGGGVDGAIHKVAGRFLLDECRTLGGCRTGEAKITAGYFLPAKYVIHTVGPRDSSETKLRNCYKNSLHEMQAKGLRSIAFSCISTGVYGFPADAAAECAVSEVRMFLDRTELHLIDRIVFCVFLERDLELYRSRMSHYFPVKSSATFPATSS